MEVAVKKAWHYCKESVTDPRSAERKEFDPSEYNSLDAAWYQKYQIALTTRERVGKPLMKRLHTIAHSQPPDFDIVLLEQITMYSMSSSSVQQIKVAGDGSVCAQQQLVAAVTTAHCVIDRITALLYSFAYVSADLPDWCLLDDARDAVQEIWAKMQHSERHQAPVSFYNDAYVASYQVWQTHIVTSGGTLTTALRSKGSWIAYWDYQCPGCPQCPGWKVGKVTRGMASQAVEPSNRQQRRALQDAVYKTMERFGHSRYPSTGKGSKYGGKSGGKFGGKKGARKQMYDKPQMEWGKGKGKGTSGKGDWNKGKGKGRRATWY